MTGGERCGCLRSRASGGRSEQERCFGKSISSCCFPASLSKGALTAAGCDFPSVAGKINQAGARAKFELQSPEGLRPNTNVLFSSRPSTSCCRAANTSLTLRKASQSSAAHLLVTLDVLNGCYNGRLPSQRVPRPETRRRFVPSASYKSNHAGYDTVRISNEMPLKSRSVYRPTELAGSKS